MAIIPYMVVMKKKILVVALLAFAFFACKRNAENISWDTELLVPIGRAKLSLLDLLKDSTVSVDKDNKLQIVYEAEVGRVKPLDTLVTLSINSFTTDVTSSSVQLEDVSINQSSTLGEMIINAGYDNYDVFGTKIRDGASIPAFAFAFVPEFDVNPTTVDISQYFQSAILEQGLLDIIIENNTPVDIAKIKIEAKDEVTNQIVFSKLFSVGNTPPNDIKSKSTLSSLNNDFAAELGGSEIHGKLTFSVTGIKLAPPAGAMTVKLNYSDNFTMKFRLHDLKVKKATAVFPAQQLVNKVEVVPVQNTEGAELTKGFIKKGQVRIEVKSTIPTPLYFTYKLPGAIKNGTAFQLPEQKIPAGTKTLPSIYSNTFLIENYDFDFTGVPQNLKDDPTYAGLPSGTVNSLIHEIYGRIDEITSPITLSLQDTLSLKIYIEELEANYVEGYFGKRTLKVEPTTMTFNFNTEVPYSNIDFEKIDVALGFKNYIGVPAALKLKSIDFTNTSKNSTKSVSGLPTTVSLPTATRENGIVKAGEGELILSNSKEIFNLVPDKVNYAFDIELNPNGNSPAYANFAHNYDELVIFTNVKFPLSVVANDFILRDTIDLASIIDKPEEIKEGILNLIVNNGFPFDTDVAISFVDKDFKVIDSFTAQDQIKGASVNSVGKVEKPLRSVVPFNLSSSQLSNLLSPDTKKIIVEITINSADKSTYKQIYSDYVFDITLSGDFRYNVKSKL